jgi:hypothetical protein
LSAAFGHHPRHDRVPLLLHPQAPAGHRRLAATHGREVFGDVRATPTASYRSVLAWRPGYPPTGLKLAIGAVIGRLRRALREDQIARAVMVNAVFDTIPAQHRTELALDWFADTCGAVDTTSGHGWLLRTLPSTVTGSSAGWLMPTFSMISKRGDQPPLLVELVRDGGVPATEFVLERFVRPYVAALSYLLFVQGIQTEGHTQNLLWEMDGDRGPTGRLVLRDLSDTSVSIPLRLARGKPLPIDGLHLPDRAPFPIATVAADYTCKWYQTTVYRAVDTVERYGLAGFLWGLKHSLERYFSSAEYNAAHIEHTYLLLWQEASIRFLGLKPLLRTDRPGLATDDAVSHYLRHHDWDLLGATSGHTLPDGVERVGVLGGARRRSGAIYKRLESAWGDLFLLDGLPLFFRPAF